MSNQTTEYIPDESEVTASSGRQSWRIANGKICKGSEDEGTLVTREKIVGRLRRVGIHEGEFTRDGKTKRVYQVEADIETAHGMERLKASLCDQKGKDAPSGVAVGLLWGLLQIGKDELMIVIASQGSKKNEFNSYPTFVNVFTLPAGAKQGVPIEKRKRIDGEDFADVQQGLIDQIRSHPAYAERPAHETDDEQGNATTHLSALCKECEAKGWPTPEQAPAEWLAMMAAAMGGNPKASIKEIPDDIWGETRLKLQDKPANEPPKMLIPAIERLSGADKQPALAGKDAFA